MTCRRGSGAAAVAVLALAASVSGCRVWFWAGDHELTLPPAAEPTPEPTPEEAAPLVGMAPASRAD